MTDILSVTDLFALAAVMLIGLPHGAFDGALAFCLGFGRSPGKIIGFLVMYLLLAGLSALIWLVSPAFALAAFLVLTIVHFGSGDTEHLFQLGPRLVQRSLKACQICAWWHGDHFVACVSHRRGEPTVYRSCRAKCGSDHGCAETGANNLACSYLYLRWRSPFQPPIWGCGR